MAKRKSKGSRGKDPKRTAELKGKIPAIIEKLQRLYPNPGLELEYSNAFELLVEAILAAQESDKKVNELARSLFKKYKGPEDVLNVPIEELERDISVINFYRRKAKLLKSCCQGLVEMFGGEVPRSVEDMVKLPGVGRKTANMVLGGAYNLPAIIVDRHVMRVSQRIGLTQEKDPDKIEFELMEIVPEDRRTLFSFLLLNHGKKLCTARDPKCGECPICDLCDSCKIKL
jgi:endonuclease-3